MGLIPADLVTDLDLLALDSSVATDFGATSLQLSEKRRVAVTDWLRPRLEQAGLNPSRHQTRRQLEAAQWQDKWGTEAWFDLKARFSSTTELDISSLIDLNFSDGLYLAGREPFRGLHFAMTDSVSYAIGGFAMAPITDAILEYWNGAWTPLDAAANSFCDGTTLTGGYHALSRAGRMTWNPPDDWYPRTVNGQPGYWVRLSIDYGAANSVAPGYVSQVTQLSRSRLTDPAANYALHLIYREGIANSRGDWKAKADLFLARADKSLELALNFVRDEFDVDEDQMVTPLEVNSVAPARDDLWSWERG
jgi:hypothetical protein